MFSLYTLSTHSCCERQLRDNEKDPTEQCRRALRELSVAFSAFFMEVDPVSYAVCLNRIYGKTLQTSQSAPL